MAQTRLGAFGCWVDAESPKHQQEQNTDSESHLCHSDHHRDAEPEGLEGRRFATAMTTAGI